MTSGIITLPDGQMNKTNAMPAAEFRQAASGSRVASVSSKKATASNR